MSNNIDLRTVFATGTQYQLKNAETPEEQAARLAAEEREHKHQLHMAWAIFWLAVVVIIIISLVGTTLVFSEKPAQVDTGRAILLALSGAVIGFVGGRLSKSNIGK